jgi:hypothetical protein
MKIVKPLEKAGKAALTNKRSAGQDSFDYALKSIE